MRTSFWSPEAREFLLSYGRQDLLDRGDAYAQRMTALMFTAMNRLEMWAKEGDLYNNAGGRYDLMKFDAMPELEDFVNNRLPDEINALEQLLEVFDDFKAIECDWSVPKATPIEVW
jgi:hypothetical protein